MPNSRNAKHSSCPNPHEVDGPKSSHGIHPALIRSIVDSLNRGDLACVERHPGWREMLPHHRALQAVFPDLTYVVEEQEELGPMVASWIRIEGTAGDAHPDLVAPGSHIRYPIVTVDRVRGNVVVEHSANPPWDGIVAALGKLRVFRNR